VGCNSRWACDSGEFGRQALIRETREELGIQISDDDIKYLVGL